MLFKTMDQILSIGDGRKKVNLARLSNRMIVHVRLCAVSVHKRNIQQHDFLTSTVGNGLFRISLLAGSDVPILLWCLGFLEIDKNRKRPTWADSGKHRNYVLVIAVK